MCVFMPICYSCVCMCVCVRVRSGDCMVKLIAKEICPVGDQNCETGPVSMGLGESRAAGKTGLEMERLPQYPVVYHHFPDQNGEESRHLCCFLYIYIYLHIKKYMCIFLIFRLYWFIFGVMDIDLPPILV